MEVVELVEVKGLWRSRVEEVVEFAEGVEVEEVRVCKKRSG